MRQYRVIFAILTILTIVFATNLLAQRGMKWRGSGGWGMGSSYSRKYEPKTVETVAGEVIAVDRMTPAKGMSYGIQLRLKTDKETISIHLGPGWYIENQDVKIGLKDKIEIKGSRITFEGKPAIIAAEVKKGDDLLMLRDDNGVPTWSGWRRK